MQRFKRVLINTTTPMLAAVALALMSADTFAEVKSEPIDGVYRIDSANCSAGKLTPTAVSTLNFAEVSHRKCTQT